MDSEKAPIQNQRSQRGPKVRLSPSVLIMRITRSLGTQSDRTDYWIRGILCWLIGLAIVFIQSSTPHDLRFRLRGSQPGRVDPRIVIVEVSESDWFRIDPQGQNVLRPLKDITKVGDGLYWRAAVWDKVLGQLIQQDPAAIGVTFHFGESARFTGLPASVHRSHFDDPRVIWSADLDSSGQVLLPILGGPYLKTVAIRSLRTDDDGRLRRYSLSKGQIPHLGVRLSELALSQSVFEPLDIASDAPASDENTATHQNSDFGFVGLTRDQVKEINFIARSGGFPTLSLKDVLDGRILAGALKGKVVLIGSRADSSEALITPLGPMSRMEVIANIVDNRLANREPKHLHWAIILLLMALLGALTTRFTAEFPQAVALVAMGVVSIAWTAMSVWLFDTYAYWLPVIGPLVQNGLTYVMLLNARAASNEERTWRLEQETQASRELEQLKTNFLSMMSHDLKTPIAKIQAICDRLLLSEEVSASQKLAFDLKNLRRSSDDLNRYIRSILQVSQIEARDLKISRVPIDINESIDRVIERLRSLADEKQQTIQKSLEPMFSIEVDPTLIEEMIHNLIENAIKYSPPGGTIEVRSSETGDFVNVIVKDSGPGISEGDQGRIWAKFTRGSQIDPSSPNGTGLGLYLVKYFAELHGGTVTLKSTLGKGAEIGFQLPIRLETPSENDSA